LKITYNLVQRSQYYRVVLLCGVTSELGIIKLVLLTGGGVDQLESLQLVTYKDCETLIRLPLRYR